MPDLIFIYGTLHPDRAPAAIAATARLLKPFGGTNNRATIPALLYNFEAYPGVVLSDDLSNTVAGELFYLPDGQDGAVTLAHLDEYEEFRPSDPPNSLFLRQQVLATIQRGPDAGAQIACWVYTYNLLVA